jgi:hypothetical protein
VARRVCRQALCRACLCTAHGKAPSSAHGNDLSARQRPHARQRGKAHGNASRARQRPLPCMYGSAHGKEFVAVRDVAVGTLPSVDARQRLCRVFCSLCRALPTHGKDTVSGSALALAPPVRGLGRHRRRSLPVWSRLPPGDCGSRGAGLLPFPR